MVSISIDTARKRRTPYSTKELNRLSAEEIRLHQEVLLQKQLRRAVEFGVLPANFQVTEMSLAVLMDTKLCDPPHAR